MVMMVMMMVMVMMTATVGVFNVAMLLAAFLALIFKLKCNVSNTVLV